MEFTHVCSTDRIAFSVISYDLDTPIREAAAESSDMLVGFVENGLFYAVVRGVVSEGTTDSEWVRLLGYRQEPYLVIACHPSGLYDYFKQILPYTQTLHVHDYDIWNWGNGGRTQIAVVTDWERY